MFIWFASSNFFSIKKVIINKYIKVFNKLLSISQSDDIIPWNNLLTFIFHCSKIFNSGKKYIFFKYLE